jgi:hypothetical protein
LGFGEWREGFFGFWEGSKRCGDKGFAGSHFLGLGEILLGSSYRGGKNGMLQAHHNTAKILNKRVECTVDILQFYIPNFIYLFIYYFVHIISFNIVMLSKKKNYHGIKNTI